MSRLMLFVTCALFCSASLSRAESVDISERMRVEHNRAECVTIIDPVDFEWTVDCADGFSWTACAQAATVCAVGVGLVCVFCLPCCPAALVVAGTCVAACVLAGTKILGVQTVSAVAAGYVLATVAVPKQVVSGLLVRLKANEKPFLQRVIGGYICGFTLGLIPLAGNGLCTLLTGEKSASDQLREVSPI